MKKILFYLLVLILTACFIGGCKRSPSSEQGGELQIKGSDTMVNAGQKISEAFMAENPNIFVAVTGGGSGVGIASLINGTCDIATSSREMKAEEIATAQKRGVQPKEIIVGFDGIAVIVHPKNPITQLTIEQLQKIFTGQAKNWKEFGGADLPIVPLSREVSSGTHAHFKEEVVRMGQKDSTAEFSADTLLLTSSQTIVEEVANNESAIGYMGMGYLSDRTKMICVGKTADACAAADIQNVITKKYPLSRSLLFYTNGEPQGIVKQFVDFTLSPQGQQQLAETGFVPLETHAGKTN